MISPKKVAMFMSSLAVTWLLASQGVGLLMKLSNPLDVITALGFLVGGGACFIIAMEWINPVSTMIIAHGSAVCGAWGIPIVVTTLLRPLQEHVGFVTGVTQMLSALAQSVFSALTTYLIVTIGPRGYMVIPGTFLVLNSLIGLCMIRDWSPAKEMSGAHSNLL